jgi:metal-sulfur cluster biosynthetic enzyme
MQNQEVLELLTIIKDPELGISIVDLGLVYKVEVTEESVDILLTFTTPACPFASSIIQQIEQIIESTLGLEAAITITFTPQWSLESIAESVKLELGLL